LVVVSPLSRFLATRLPEQLIYVLKNLEMTMFYDALLAGFSKHEALDRKNLKNCREQNCGKNSRAITFVWFIVICLWKVV